MEESTLTVNQKSRRDKLFATLEAILVFAEEKRKTVNLADKTKQAWSRIAISAISTYGSILRDVELDDILERLDALEKDSELNKLR
jgi:hypothetical protein